MSRNTFSVSIPKVAKVRLYGSFPLSAFHVMYVPKRVVSVSVVGDLYLDVDLSYALFSSAGVP